MKLSFSHRIFGAMFMVIFCTAVLIVLLFSYYFKDQSEHYHEDRLKRKEERIIASIEYELDEFPETVTEFNVAKVLNNRILGISSVNSQKINLFKLNGELLLSSETKEIQSKLLIPTEVLNQLSTENDRTDIPDHSNPDQIKIDGYRYLYNLEQKPIAIVNLPYYANNQQFEKDQNLLIYRFVVVIILIFVIGGIIAWLMTNQITKRLKSIALKLKNTGVVQENTPIIYKDNDEVKVIVDSYNEMLYKLKKQSTLLAKQEREEAWREVAKQVAHEVKNPLTPMRLLIQNFKQRFDPNAENAREKVEDLSDTLLNQIDVISSISEAFSDFATMPLRHDESLNLVEEIQLCINVFKNKNINYEFDREKIQYKFDKNYLNRLITNLVKNAIQSVPVDREAQIVIGIKQLKDYIHITVQDNGIGISESRKEKIFQPKFTTKSGGMGLGLPMVKKIVEDYLGTISFKSTENKGTTFTIELPLR